MQSRLFLLTTKRGNRSCFLWMSTRPVNVSTGLFLSERLLRFWLHTDAANLSNDSRVSRCHDPCAAPRDVPSRPASSAHSRYGFWVVRRIQSGLSISPVLGELAVVEETRRASIGPPGMWVTFDLRAEVVRDEMSQVYITHSATRPITPAVRCGEVAALACRSPNASWLELPRRDSVFSWTRKSPQHRSSD